MRPEMLAASEFVTAFRHDWPVLLSIPVTAALVGWSTKLLAIKMMFSPEKFRGVGPIGWQGMVPRRTAKFASIAAETLIGRLIDPRRLIDEIDPHALIATLEQPLIDVSDDIAREFLARYHPGLWDAMPEAARQIVIRRVQARAPEAVARMLADVRDNIDTAFDPTYAVIDNMVRNKAVMTRLVKEIALPEFGFMIRMGTIFGGAIGVVQMLVWAGTHNHLVLPLFGGFVGLFTDWIALTMILAPRAPTRYLGVFRWQGLFFKRRAELSRAYARVAADSLLTPSVMLQAVLDGPLADRFLALIAREVQLGINAELGPSRPLVELAVGSERYRDLKRAVTTRAQDLIPDVRDDLEGFAQRAFDVETIVADAMMEMDDGEYEGILRPMFKDDEWLIILLGGVLGFLVGELQVTVLTHL